MKSIAPSFIARTATGTSPWPVITITGQSISRFGQLGHDMEAVHLRHPQVEQDAARLKVGNCVEEVLARAERMRAHVRGAEHEAQRSADVAIIVDNIDVMGIQSSFLRQ